MATILHIEDRPNLLKQVKNTLADEGLRVLQAISKSEAIAMYRKMPGEISGVLTDIRLEEDDPQNIDGIKIAEEIRRLNPRMPLFGYSGHEQFGAHEHFDKYFVKGSPNAEESLVANINKIVNAVESYSTNRFEHVSSEILDVAKKYKISSEDLSTLSRCMPWSDEVFKAVYELHESFSEETSTPKNRSIELISKDSEIGSSLGLVNSVPILIINDTDTFVCELLTFPMIYAYGDGPDVAITEFLEVLNFYRDAFSSTEIEIEHEIPRLKKYLEHCFEKSL